MIQNIYLNTTIRKDIRATPLCIFQKDLFNEDYRTTSLISTIKHENSTQNYNRYSYCINNPLKYTDPSGYQYSGYDPAKTQIMIDKINSGLQWGYIQWFEGLPSNKAEWSMLDALSHIGGGAGGGGRDLGAEMFLEALEKTGYDPDSGVPPTDEQLSEAFDIIIKDVESHILTPFDMLTFSFGMVHSAPSGGGGVMWGWAFVRDANSENGWSVHSFKTEIVNDIYGITQSLTANYLLGVESVWNKDWFGFSVGFGLGGGGSYRRNNTIPWY